MLLRLIRRHDFPERLGEEDPVDAKLLDLRQAESLYFFLSKDCKEWLLPLFHDKLLPVDGEDTISELENVSASFSFSFTFDEVGFRSSLLSADSAHLESENIASWSEPESNSSETSDLPLFSKMERTAAVAFSAFFLCSDTIFSCSSSSKTYNTLIKKHSPFPLQLQKIFDKID